LEHLKYLSWFNYAFAAFAMLGAAFAALGGVAVVGMTLASGAELSAIIAPAIAMGVTFFILLVLGLVYLMAGRRVSSGRGRILQSILSVLAIGNVPIGTIYGAYGLWVCWMNEDTKKAFDEPYGILP
jgi:hypothetical protein